MKNFWRNETTNIILMALLFFAADTLGALNSVNKIIPYAGVVFTIMILAVAISIYDQFKMNKYKVLLLSRGVVTAMTLCIFYMNTGSEGAKVENSLQLNSINTISVMGLGITLTILAVSATWELRVSLKNKTKTAGNLSKADKVAVLSFIFIVQIIAGACGTLALNLTEGNAWVALPIIVSISAVGFMQLKKWGVSYMLKMTGLNLGLITIIVIFVSPLTQEWRYIIMTLVLVYDIIPSVITGGIVQLAYSCARKYGKKQKKG